MSHDVHHAAVKLQYQPSLPLGNGKLCLWLFLSTEIMFFAGLIGTYIVLRFGAPPGTWPKPHDVHLVEIIGALNTFVLLMSSVTIVLALESSRNNVCHSPLLFCSRSDRLPPTHGAFRTTRPSAFDGPPRGAHSFGLCFFDSELDMARVASTTHFAARTPRM